MTLMATQVEDNLIQINDFVNEQGYRGSGQKLAADSLLNTSLTFFLKKVLIFFDLGAFVLVSSLICKSCNFPSQNYFPIIGRRTYESDAVKIEDVEDLDDLVADKREAWRATFDTARRRHRRYKKRLTKRLVLLEAFEELEE